MDIDFNNPLEAILGLFGLLIVVIIAVTFLSNISNVLTADKCRPFQNQIEENDFRKFISAHFRSLDLIIVIPGSSCN